jgi:hypothetical protein
MDVRFSAHSGLRSGVKILPNAPTGDIGHLWPAAFEQMALFVLLATRARTLLVAAYLRSLSRPLYQRAQRINWLRGGIFATAASIAVSCSQGQSINPARRMDPVPGSRIKPAHLPAFTLYLRSSQWRPKLFISNFYGQVIAVNGYAGCRF